jgi:hypothetical protein
MVILSKKAETLTRTGLTFLDALACFSSRELSLVIGSP